MLKSVMLIGFLSVCFSNFGVSAQVTKSKKPKSSKIVFSSIKSKADSSDKGKKNEEKDNEPAMRGQFRSPFRYIIISNITEEDLGLDIPQRRLEVLMDERAFGEKNLRLLITLLKNRFPLPVRLEIKVHTSLETVETPEEGEITSDHTGLENEENFHRTALYIRFDDGAEDFTYDYGNSPNFKSKSIILNDLK